MFLMSLYPKTPSGTNNG